MPLTISSDNLSASGLSYSGTFPTPIPAPGPQTGNYNSTYTGALSRVRSFLISSGPIGLQASHELLIPTLTDNQSYPGIPSGVVAGGNAGIRLLRNINTTVGTTSGDSTPYIMQVYTDSPASNTFPLQVGSKFNQGGPSTQYIGGIAVQGLSTFNSTPVGPVAVGSLSATVQISRSTPAPLGTSATTLLDMNAGGPGVVAYYVRFQQGGAERGTIWTPGSTTTYATSSDYRLKDNITPLDPEEELQRVNELRPRKWNWKNNQDPGIGFIAHEIQEDIEDANKLGIVSGNKDSVTRKGRICDVATGEPYSEKKIDETTGEETLTYFYIDEPDDEEKAQMAADGKEWVYHHDEPVYQGIDTSFLASSTVAAIQALTNKVVALESRVAALESM